MGGQRSGRTCWHSGAERGSGGAGIRDGDAVDGRTGEMGMRWERDAEEGQGQLMGDGGAGRWGTRRDARDRRVRATAGGRETRWAMRGENGTKGEWGWNPKRSGEWGGSGQNSEYERGVAGSNGRTRSARRDGELTVAYLPPRAARRDPGLVEWERSEWNGLSPLHFPLPWQATGGGGDNKTAGTTASWTTTGESGVRRGRGASRMERRAEEVLGRVTSCPNMDKR